MPSEAVSILIVALHSPPHVPLLLLDTVVALVGARWLLFARFPRQLRLASAAQLDLHQRLLPFARFFVDERQLERPQSRHT